MTGFAGVALLTLLAGLLTVLGIIYRREVVAALGWFRLIAGLTLGLVLGSVFGAFTPLWWATSIPGALLLSQLEASNFRRLGGFVVRLTSRVSWSFSRRAGKCQAAGLPRTARTLYGLATSFLVISLTLARRLPISADVSVLTGA